MAHFITERAAIGDHIYVASLDIKGAFDTVPHEGLSNTLQRIDMDPHCRRFVDNWIGSRRFRVRLLTPMGKTLSTPREITRGLPQGGILSPLLWVLHFSRFGALFEEGPGGPSRPGVRLCTEPSIPFLISNMFISLKSPLCPHGKAEGEFPQISGYRSHSPPCPG